jgi:hypothetical protein
MGKRVIKIPAPGMFTKRDSFPVWSRPTENYYLTPGKVRIPDMKIIGNYLRMIPDWEERLLRMSVWMVSTSVEVKVLSFA